MSENKLYLEAAEQLRSNPGQWQAYTSEGHCVVLAGPGSGKTKTLTIKLARLLAEDVEPPRGVACITYNNECARELETRLEGIGIEAGHRVFIGTVHSFSLTQIILPYAKTANLGLPDDFRVASKAERALALERAHQKVIGGPGNPQDMNFIMGNYRRSILNRNSEKWRTSKPQLAKLVEVFEQELRAQGCIDFDDMPLLAVKALRENPWLQQALYAKFPALIVDEYQDLGRALHRMVLGLCFSAGMRLFAVGDADQSIYGFQGAHPELLQKLSEREDVETVHLRLNYRCGSQIIAASSFALGEERGYVAVDGAEEGTIYFHPQSGQYQQHAEYIFTALLPAIQTREPTIQLGDIAILYPAAWIGDAVAAAAQAEGIPFIRTDVNALYPRHSRLMRWLEQCAQWCAGGWRSGAPRFARITNDAKRLFSEILLTDEDNLSFQHQLMTTLWKTRDSTLLLNEWLDKIYSQFVLDYLAMCPTLVDEHEIVTRFIERTITGGDCEDMTVGQFAGQGEGNNCINLSTLHSSKGREFSVVIMFGMDNGRLPRNNSTPNQVAESRRLFYVGFTRAESELHFMYSEDNPSPFVTEVFRRVE